MAKKKRDFLDTVIKFPIDLIPKEEEQAGQIPFPLEIISGPAGKFVDAFSGILEAPRQFWYMAYLTCLGSIVADKLTWDTALDVQPRLYTVLLGESAYSRKSTAIKVTAKFFGLHPGFYTVGGCGSGESLGATLQEERMVLLCYDELKSLIDKSSSNQTLLNAVHILFDNNTYENRVLDSKRSIRVENGYLSLLAASTTHTFKTLFDAKHVDLGFCNRLFLVPGKSKKKNPIPGQVSADEVEDVFISLFESFESAVTKLRSMDRFQNNRYEYHITDDADERFGKWYREEWPKELCAGRLENYGLRLMLLLAFNDGKGEIDLETVEKTIKLLNWQLKVRRLCHPVVAAGAAAKTMEQILRQLEDEADGITRGILARNVGVSHYGWGYFNTAIKWLLTEGFIVEYTRRNKPCYKKK